MDALKVMLLVPFTAYCIQMTVLAATDERFEDKSVSYECTTDFLLTINCSLNVKSDLGDLHVLTLAKRPTNRSYVCAQSNGTRLCFVTVGSTSGDSCSFSDYSLFRIWLCPEQSRVQNCHELDKSYKPSKHIKPKAPCWLSVVRNASRQRFTWKNNYEKCLFTKLKDYLQYQLCIYKQQDDTKCHYINVDKTEHTVDDAQLEMDTEYFSKVRSKPSGRFFDGQWSDWSQEIRWRTSSGNVSLVEDFLDKPWTKVFLGSALTATFILILICVLLIKWRNADFIPTPAPYFQNLFNECHGDFKSWADTQPNVTMTLKSDDTLQVDGHEYQSPALYKNLPLHDDSLIGRSGSMPNEGKAEGRPDGEHPRYSNDYCTLSALQHSINNAGKFQSGVGKPNESLQNVYFV
ncbi:interleukin-21 receptor [Stigmatopora argus]